MLILPLPILVVAVAKVTLFLISGVISYSYFENNTEMSVHCGDTSQGDTNQMSISKITNTTTSTIFTNDVETLLAKRLPESTLAERRRFLIARNNDIEEACSMLQQYLQWRRDNNNYAPCTTHRSLMKGTVMFHEEQTRTKTTTITSTTTKINHDTTGAFISYDDEGCTETLRHASNDNHEILYLNHGPPYAKDSTRICHVMPGLLNSHNGVSPHEQANRVALFLDRCLSRDTMEKITVIIDTRAGLGWSNPSPLQILPFIKIVGGLLNTLFPERLQTCVILPVPQTCVFLYNIIKPFIDPNTVRKIILIGGPTHAHASLKDEILQYIDPTALHYMENRRCSLFLKTSTANTKHNTSRNASCISNSKSK
jgi:hypothetical protein